MEEGKILVTFDIDGTLMLAGNRGQDHRDSMRHALNVLYGINLCPSEYLQTHFAGYSDYKIVTECVRKATNKEEVTPEEIYKFYDIATEKFKEIHTGNTIVYPGIYKALENLSQHKNVIIGLCTGNIPGIGWIKLEKTNMAKYFDRKLGGLGSHPNRADILQSVIDKATELYGKIARVIHVGDAMQDVQAALDVGALAVAVDTGSQRNKIFKQPCFVFENLEVCMDDFMSVVLTGKTVSGADHVDQKFK